jgi:uncharacterized protein YidB (DUF937 family)
MGLFDGILGGVIGGGMAAVVGDLLERHGGVQGIVSELQAKGLGDTVQSWVGTGANQAVSGAQLQGALGPDTIAQLAAKLGVSPAELSSKLSEVLPQAIDKLTPGGVVPRA